MANLEENINNEIDIKHDEPVKIHLDEESAEVTAVEGDYGANQIQILEGLEAVRKRQVCILVVHQLVDYII